MADAGLSARVVRFDVAKGEQDFHVGHITGGISFLHLVPKRGDGRARIRAQIRMQSPNETTVELFHPRIYLCFSLSLFL